MRALLLAGACLAAVGVVKAVEPRLGPAGGTDVAVILDTTALAPDGVDAVERSLAPIDWRTATKEELLARVNEAGICGMGGAGFPASVKLNPPPGKRCEYLIVNGSCYWILSFLFIFRYTLQGLGYSVQAVISGVGELIGRALGGWLAVHQLGYLGICISNPLAWGFALCYCVFMVTRVLKKESRAA